jgi:hypothetical protein
MPMAPTPGLMNQPYQLGEGVDHKDEVTYRVSREKLFFSK